MLDNTLLGYIVHNADQFPDRIAIREKRYGVWDPTSWKQFAENVKNFALGLKSLGIEKGDTLTIIGDNKPEWIIAEYGCMAAEGVPTGVYPDSMVDEIEYLVSYSDAKYIVARDQEQVDKILEFWDRVKDMVKKVIVWDSRGMSHYYGQYPFLMRFEELIDLGKAHPESENDFLKKTAEALDPATPALMLTTSGTTAKPKLSILTHESLVKAAKSYETIVDMKQGDELLSLAPLAWVGEQLYNVIRFIMVGAHYNFPEETETVRRDLLELQPYYFGGTPATWELLISTIQAAMDNADFFKRYFYNLAISVAMRKTEAELGGLEPATTDKILHSFLDFFVLRSLKNKVGLGRVRTAFTGGGAISPEVFKYFKALGIDLRQVYGQTECSGIATTHLDGDIRPETVGVPIPGVEVKLSDEGEILVKGDGLHSGYYKNEQATKDSFTEDGFLRTGDAGYFGNDGHLYVFDRQKDIMHLTDGTRFAPQDLETRLKFSAYIHEAMICGADKDYVVGIVSIDLENVGNWAKKRNISFTTFQDLSQRPEVYELIHKEIKDGCERFPENIRIKKFAILLKELHADDGELTRTRKVRRSFVNERYQSLIDDLYGSVDQHNLDIQIRYEDGRVSAFQGKVKIEEISH